MGLMCAQVVRGDHLQTNRSLFSLFRKKKLFMLSQLFCYGHKLAADLWCVFYLRHQEWKENVHYDDTTFVNQTAARKRRVGM